MNLSTEDRGPRIGDRRSLAGIALANGAWIVLLFYLTRTAYYLFFHPLRKVPGPALARVTRAWRNIRYFRGTWLDDIVHLHQKYGPVVRITPNDVSFVDDNALKQLYGHGKPNQKTSWYNTWIFPGKSPSFFAITDPKLHRQVRSRVTAAYTMSSMLSYEPSIQEVLDTNWSKFRQLAKTGKNFDMSVLVSYFTYDVVSQLALGGMLGYVEKQQDVQGLIESLHNGTYMSANMGDVPGQMYWFLNPICQQLLAWFGDEKLNAINIFFGWLDKQVQDRMKNGLEPGRPWDMLQYFVEAKDQQGRHLSKEEVVAESGNILGAGADTTIVAILAVLGQILTNPNIKKQLQAEIDQAYHDLRLVDGQEIGFQDAAKLPFLSAVVKESMRLHPSITYQLPRAAPEQGITIDGHHLPKGVVCGISPAAMNRSTEIFGEDAANFRPERWIPVSDDEAEGKRIRVMDSKLTTFGMGSRSCIGRNVALVEVHKYIAQFMRNFDAELVNKKKPWITKSLWFAFQSEFWVRLEERQN